jgi:small GTP-binding protein
MTDTTMMESYREHKEQVTATLSRLAELAGELGMRSLRADIEGVRLPKLAEDRFNLVVLGEFNHGKSTFVNALLGEDILPVGITPTTATINHIVWAEEPRARAVLRDGGTEEVNPAELADWVTLEGDRSEGIRYVELAYPGEILRNKVTLVDTPGVNDINEARAEITYSYIPRADAVIFLLDATQVLKRSERAFIQQRLLRRSRDKLIFVLGKADLLDETELAEATAFAQEHLTELVEDPVIFAISPRKHLEGEVEKGGMGPLLEFLRSYLNEQRGRVLLDNALADGERTVSYIRSNLGIKLASLDLDLDELSKRIAEVRQRLDGSQQNLRESLQRIRNEAEAIKATVRHDLRLFCDAFCQALPGEIDKADASDVKRYLQFFIQDKFKEWAELEGDKSAGLLEDLAEEIIQITNQNVHEVMDAVTAGFGSSMAKVDLEVDTLRYDVGVFALGALGTTVFLFVNTFVGGLLTLAAPVLAVVLHEKVGAKIKAQARERAPEVVRKAADAIKPRFEEIVDDFADRLDEFVTSAGESLHRGISELLDQALAERGQREVDADVVKESLGAQEAQLKAVEQEFGRIRESLWASTEPAEPPPAASAPSEPAPPEPAPSDA